MVVDALTHVHPDKDGFGGGLDARVESLVENLDRAGVDRAVVTAIAADTAYGTSSEYVAECCRRFPDRIIGFASVNPLRDPDATAKLERCVTEFGLRGLKLHPRHQQLSVDDTKVVPVVEKAAELGIPVMICGSQWKHAPLAWQDPSNVDTLCKRVPEAKIIIAHGGGFRFWDAFIVAVANENVYLETSIVLNYFHETPYEEQYRFTLEKLGPSRLIYGSDHPEDPAGDCYPRSRAVIESYGFNPQDCEKIFGENILALTRTSPPAAQP